VARRIGVGRTAVARRGAAAGAFGSGPEQPSGLSRSRPNTGNGRAGVIQGRRRALPTGRAVIGGFLVAVAAVIVFGAALASAGTHETQYAVATRTLAVGSVIGPGDLSTEGAKLPSSVESQAFRSTGSLIGRSIAVTVDPGELIQASMLSPVGASSGLRPVSVTVDPDSLSGLSPGDAVDVLATADSTDSSSSTAPVTVVLRGASLISVSPADSSLLSGSTSGPLVTLGVSDLSEVEAVVQAAHAGTITLVLAEPGDGIGPGDGTAVPLTTVPAGPSSSPSTVPSSSASSSS
jgi:Flp pilus assembly protein CpaB